MVLLRYDSTLTNADRLVLSDRRRFSRSSLGEVLRRILIDYELGALSVSLSDEIKERIRERVSLVELISESVEVKRSGRRHTALCPFHHEKTPSFSINEEEGFYHCFGCGKHGDCFTFLMEKRGFSFPEALKFLANRVGVELPETFDRSAGRSSEARDHRSVLRRVCRVAQEVYHASLGSSAHARRYLEERGLTQQTIDAFRLGYAPAGYGFLLSRCEEVLKQEVPQLGEVLTQAGLLVQRKSDRSAAPEPAASLDTLNDLTVSGDSIAGSRNPRASSAWDFFRDRVIFPIQRSDGAPIAFGGRILVSGSHAPKYLNTPESLVYQKRRTFYGVHQAHEAIRANRVVHIVEGYMDVLALHQAGIRNVLATCGTSLTDEHAALLRRLVDRVVLLFDGDSAGRKAAAQCFERFLNSGVAVDVALLPDGYDPDTFVQKSGADGLLSLIQQQRRPLLNVFIDHLFRTAQGDAPESGPYDAALCGKVATRVASVLALVVNPVEREVLVGEAAGSIGVTAASIQSLMNDRLRVAANEQFQGTRDDASARYSSANRRGDYSSGYRSNSNFNSGSAAGASRSARSRPVAATAPPSSGVREIRDRYLRQLLIAVICQPLLAREVLLMPSFQLPDGRSHDEGARGDRDPLGMSEISDNLDPQATDLQGTGTGATFFPPAVRSALEALSDGTFFGLSIAMERDDQDPLLVEERMRIEDLLRSCGLPAEELTREAIRQLRIGGAKPTSVVAEADIASTRSNLKVEVHQLQLEESTISDGEAKLKLAQAKLLKRRNLDRLANPGGRPKIS